MLPINTCLIVKRSNSVFLLEPFLFSGQLKFSDEFAKHPGTVPIISEFGRLWWDSCEFGANLARACLWREQRQV